MLGKYFLLNYHQNGSSPSNVGPLIFCSFNFNYVKQPLCKGSRASSQIVGIDFHCERDRYDYVNGRIVLSPWSLMTIPYSKV
jgi:hypothetical protein